MLVNQLQNKSNTIHYLFPEILPEEPGLAHSDCNEDGILHSMGAFDLPPKRLGDVLVEAYFEWVAPMVPVVNRTHFMTRYQNTRDPPSILLLQSVLLAGSKVCGSAQKVDADSQVTYTPAAFYQRAKALYEAHYEHDRTTLIQSLVLMGWYCEDSQHSFKDVSYWTCLAITIAQGSGMHRSTDDFDLSIADRRLWKRIWWTLYTRDRSIAVVLDRPVFINYEDIDVEMLGEDDFADGPEFEKRSRHHRGSTHVQFFIQQVKLCNIIDVILSQLYTTIPLRQSTKDVCIKYIDMLLAEWQNDCPKEVFWVGSRHHFWSAVLQVNY